MEISDKIKKLIETFKVANDDILGNTARLLYNLNWKEGLSARNQAHKILDELALTDQIIKGKRFYAVKGYQGQFKEHDRKLTEIIARLITLKLPISIHREVSFPVGLRSDMVCLIGKSNRAICAVIEVANHEIPEYMNQKIAAWKNWTEAPQALSDLLKTPIPHFSIITYGISHPLAVDFENFIKEVSNELSV